MLRISQYYYILFVGCLRWSEIQYVLCECWYNVRTVHVVSFSLFALAHFKQPLLACPSVCKAGWALPHCQQGWALPHCQQGRVGPAPLSVRVGHKAVLRLLVWFFVICCYHAFFVLGMTGNGMLFLRRNVAQYHYQLKIIFIDAVFVCLQACVCVWQHLGKVSVIHVRILLYTEYLGKVSGIHVRILLYTEYLGKVSVIHVRILLYTEYLGKVSGIHVRILLYTEYLGKVSGIHVRILLYTEYLGKVSVIPTCQNIALH